MSSSELLQHFWHPKLKSSQSVWGPTKKKKKFFGAICCLKWATKEWDSSCQAECPWSKTKPQIRICLRGYYTTVWSFNSWLIPLFNKVRLELHSLLCQRLTEGRTLQYPDWSRSIMIYLELGRIRFVALLWICLYENMSDETEQKDPRGRPSAAIRGFSTCRGIYFITLQTAVCLSIYFFHY